MFFYLKKNKLYLLWNYLKLKSAFFKLSVSELFDFSKILNIVVYIKV